MKNMDNITLYFFLQFRKNIIMFTQQKDSELHTNNYMDNITTRQPEERKVKEGFVGEKRIVLPPNIKRGVLSNRIARTFYSTAIGYYPHATFHNMERKAGCGQYVLIYCIEGEGHVVVDGQRHTLMPNSYFIIAKHAPHRYYASTYHPWSIYWIHFCGDYDDQLYQRFTTDGRPEVRNIPYEAYRVQLFEQAYNLLEQSYDMHDIELINLNLLHFVTSLIYYKERNTVLDNEDKVTGSITFMQNNLNMQFSITELAQQQQVSVSHYSRIFKQRTGHTPIHYFNQLKIQKSCQYLYFTDKSIKEISTLFGIGDSFYFSRLFRKLMGISPLQYRNTHKSGSLGK